MRSNAKRRILYHFFLRFYSNGSKDNTNKQNKVFHGTLGVWYVIQNISDIHTIS